MNSFTVIYQFLCPNCNHFAVGTKVFNANGPDEASHMLSAVELSCRVCHRTVMTETLAQTLVCESTDQEASESATGPAVPRT